MTMSAMSWPISQLIYDYSIITHRLPFGSFIVRIMFRKLQYTYNYTYIQYTP